MTALPAGVYALAGADCLASSASRLWLVQVASWSTVLVPGLLDLVLKPARWCARGALLQSSVSQNLVLAVPMCTLVYTLVLKS
jgi:hypothetical protein